MNSLSTNLPLTLRSPLTNMGGAAHEMLQESYTLFHTGRRVLEGYKCMRMELESSDSLVLLSLEYSQSSA